MGFYTTDTDEVRQENTFLARQSHPAKSAPPSKNRVWNFFTCSETCVGFFESQPVESHQEKWPTPTTTVSGVHYYGYRYYKADMGRWVSRDPIAEKGGVAIYGFSKNNGVGRVDFLGLISIPVGSWTVDVTESGGSATYSLPPINIVVPFIVGWFGYIYQINGNGDVVINVTPNGLEEFDCTALPDDPSTTTSATTCSFSFASGLSCTSTKTVQNSSKMAQTEVTYGLQGFVVSASMNATGEARYRKWIDYPMCKCFDGKATLNYTVSTSGDLLKAALGGVLILASQYFIVPVAANVGLPVPAFVVP